MAKVEGLYKGEMVELIESEDSAHLIVYRGKKIWIPVKEFRLLKVNDGWL